MDEAKPLSAELTSRGTPGHVVYAHPVYGELRVKDPGLCSRGGCEEPGRYRMAPFPPRFCAKHGPEEPFYQTEPSWREAFGLGPKAGSGAQMALFEFEPRVRWEVAA